MVCEEQGGASGIHKAYVGESCCVGRYGSLPHTCPRPFAWLARNTHGSADPVSLHVLGVLQQGYRDGSLAVGDAVVQSWGHRGVLGRSGDHFVSRIRPVISFSNTGRRSPITPRPHQGMGLLRSRQSIGPLSQVVLGHWRGFLRPRSCGVSKPPGSYVPGVHHPPLQVSPPDDGSRSQVSSSVFQACR